MNLVGVYLAGDSWLHRLPAGVKVAGMMVFIVAGLLISSPWWTLGLLAVAIACLLSAGVPLRHLARPLLLVVMVAVALGVFQWWQMGWRAAVVTVARLLAFALIAWAVSLTTRVSAMTGVLLAVLRPLRVIGVNADKVALTLALAIRSIPLLMDAMVVSQHARMARGNGRTVVGAIVPMVVRSVRLAEAMGDALVARGYDGRATAR